MEVLEGRLHGPSYRTIVADTLPVSQATAWRTAPAAKLSILQHQHLSCMDASRRQQGRAPALPLGPRGSSHIQYHAHGAQPLSCPIWALSTTSASHPTLSIVIRWQHCRSRRQIPGLVGEKSAPVTMVEGPRRGGRHPLSSSGMTQDEVPRQSAMALGTAHQRSGSQLRDALEEGEAGALVPSGW